jgi:hypothetical protein
MRPESSGARRKLDSTEGPNSNEQRQKKRKTSMLSASTPAIITPPLDQSSALPSVNAVDDVLREDSVTAENVDFARVS